MELIWPTPNDIVLTVLRWIIGLLLGATMGLLIALLEKRKGFQTRPERRKRLSPLTAVFDFLRALPIIALVPVIQTIGIGEGWKIALIAWAVMFPTWLSVRQARGKQLLDTEIALIGRGSTNREIFSSYRFPKAFGGLLKGVEISIGVAWLSVVAAEWIGTYTTGFWAGGLGYKVVKAHDANNWSGMLLCLILFGVLGITTAWAWRTFFSRDKELSPGFNPMCGYRDQR